MTQIGYQSIIFFVVLFAAFLMASRMLSPQITQGKNLDHSIEGLRGVACILVFINHAPWILYGNNFANSIINYKIFSGYTFGSIGVELFFCITGFLFSEKIKKCHIDPSFFIKRVKRLAPAYLCVSLLVLIIYIAKYGYLIHGFNDFSSLIKQVFGFGFGLLDSGIILNGVLVTSLNVVTWTLPYEWKFYAAIPFVAVIIRNKPATLLSLVFLTFIIYGSYIENNFLWMFFISGFAASYIKPVENKKYRYLLIAPCLVSICVCFLNPEDQYGISKFISVSLFFAMFVLAKPFVFRFNSISKLGTISYGIYLTHQPISSIIVTIASKLIKIGDLDLIGLLALNSISAFFTVLASALLYKFVERKFM